MPYDFVCLFCSDYFSVFLVPSVVCFNTLLKKTDNIECVYYTCI